MWTLFHGRPFKIRGRELWSPIHTRWSFAKGGDAENKMPHLVHFQGNINRAISNLVHFQGNITFDKIPREIY